MADRTPAPMTSRKMILAGIVAATFAASPGMAEEQAVPDNEAVDATIAALEAGDADELAWLISQVETLGHSKKYFQTPSEAVAALSKCDAKETGRRGMHTLFEYKFEWTCGDTQYIGSLVPDENNKSVALVDLASKADAAIEEERNKSWAMAPPPAPPPAPNAISEAERARRAMLEAKRQAREMQLAQEFSDAVTAGDVAGFVPRVPLGGNISFSFYNPFLSQAFIEKQGVGGEALAEQVAYAHDTLGAPSGASCKRSEPLVMCSWDFPDTTTKMMAFLRINGREQVERPLWRVDFRYVTSEKLNAALERAAN